MEVEPIKNRAGTADVYTGTLNRKANTLYAGSS
jgi:hypothetical protein